jgi:hypothetical protein
LEAHSNSLGFLTGQDAKSNAYLDSYINGRYIEDGYYRLVPRHSEWSARYKKISVPNDPNFVWVKLFPCTQ